MSVELLCLATAIFFEARGEPIDGKELVANVIINRVESNKYPDTICGVVNQRKQFSYTHDGMSDNPLKYNSYHDSLAWEESKDIARYVLDTGVINEYILMYHNTSVDPYWTDAYDVSGMVGSHIFYRKKDQ
jgi:spore germination cell wall hydrolase CwlJ-like protein